MSQPQGFSRKIIHVYIIGASTLLAFYIIAFHVGVLLTENAVLEMRINKVADFHFQRYQQGETGRVTIDPLLTLYDSHADLPLPIQHSVRPGWTGTMHLVVDDDNDGEFQIVARLLLTPKGNKIVYAIENSEAVEWMSNHLLLIGSGLSGVGILGFMITAGYMVRAARKISYPFADVAGQLDSDSSDNFTPIIPQGEESKELNQIVVSINAYREHLSVQLEREKSFTRYVSHELRTPMMIIKGVMSNVRSSSGELSHKYQDKIERAVEQMEALTTTFLLLARQDRAAVESIKVDAPFIEQIALELTPVIEGNQVTFKWTLCDELVLAAQPLLVKVTIINLLKNAFACSVGGRVHLVVGKQGIEVLDNGVGLGTKVHAYEGFGVGLVLVQDICNKYGWRFSLVNNLGKGCHGFVGFR